MILEKKTAIVTGAGTHIGRELAREFARQGAGVVCCGRRPAELEETVRLIREEGGTAVAIPADVTDPVRVEALVLQTLERFGQIDLLFNNAGSFRSVAPIWEANPADWWQDVTTNLYGSMLCCRAVLPPMMARNTGVIINMDGGGGAHAPNIAGSGYGASKAALLRFTEGLARELEIAGSAVLAFAIGPGFVHTAMTQAIADSPTGQKWQPFVKDRIAQKNTHQPWDCAQATMRLLAIAGPEINGCTFDVATDFDQIDRHKAEIRANALYVLRLKSLGR
jgi:NAD(P)-dependent dehydrogenase (short-subunit alcohol dehydrogenase family)